MTNILILGGGFAGVAAGLSLIKHFKKNPVDITLIDEESYHVFTPSLYEVATSEEPQKNIAIPYQKIFNNRLKVIVNNIDLIDLKNQKVILKNRQKIHWDYLVVCLGSQTAYYGIAGIEKYSLPFKKLSDAVKIKESIEKIFRQKSLQREKIQLVIGGGGFSGTELTAELTNLRNRLLTNQPNSNFIQITVIEATARLLNNLDPKISEIAQKRLEFYKVRLIFNCKIKEVTESFIETELQKYPYDLLIWTGGVKANNILEKSGFNINQIGQIKVNNNLQVISNKNIFAAGDCALYLDPKTAKPIPCLGQVAKEQGKIAGENVYRQISNLKLKDYQYKHRGFIIPLGGHYVVAALNSILLTGFPAWILQQLVFLRYLLEILPISQAFKRWNKFEWELKQDQQS